VAWEIHNRYLGSESSSPLDQSVCSCSISGIRLTISSLSRTEGPLRKTGWKNEAGFQFSHCIAFLISQVFQEGNHQFHKSGKVLRAQRSAETMQNFTVINRTRKPTAHAVLGLAQPFCQGEKQ